MKKIILFELNEVPWRIINDYIFNHPDSAIARISSCANLYETVAEDSELSPWITWPSLHRGISDKQHTISNFGQCLDEIDKAYPPIWKIVANNGNQVGVFGSLHTHPLPSDLSNYAFHIPDVFAAGSECFPKSVEAYQSWNLGMSRGSARNVSTKIPFLQTAKFLGSLPALGIKFNTAMEVGKHLVDERKSNWKVVRRRTQQVLIAFDVFMNQLERTRPSFTTFFTNHVASTMHRYWAAQFPGDYDEFGYSEEWKSTHKHEIDWTLSKFDNMLQRLLSFVETNSEYDIWIASSMGQAATRANTPAKSQLYIENIDLFMSYLGINDTSYKRKPAMAPRIIIQFESDRVAQEFASKTKDIWIPDVSPTTLAPGEIATVNVKNLDHNVFMIRVPVIQNSDNNEITINGVRTSMSKLGMKHVRVADQSGQTAYHIPEGSLMIYSNGNNPNKGNMATISTLDVAPMLLKNFAIPVPAYMNKSP